MRPKAICAIMLTMILISILSIGFNSKLVEAETNEKRDLDDPLKETNEIAQSSKDHETSPAETSNEPWYKIFQKDQGIEGVGELSHNILSNPENKGETNETNGWSDFAFVDGNLTRIIVGIDNEEPKSHLKLEKLIDEYDGKIVSTVIIKGQIIAAVVEIPIYSASAFMRDARATEFTSYVEPNMKFQISLVPNDPYWSYQWGPSKIEADWAWNTTVGDPSILVAVVDTGIDYYHADLAANYVPLGYDWANNDTDPWDDHGHGTHCAGIIGAEINNSIGVAGLARVQIMAEKALDQYGWGYADWLANAIIHATDQGANIISISWGHYWQSELLQEAIQYAYNASVLLVASAGNENTDLKLYPAGYDEVIAVTATDVSDERPAWSNFGDWVELAAPGVHIYSTVPWGYDYSSGTSMASPHVAGVAALVWSQFPNVTRDWLRLWLRYTVDDIGDPGFDIYYGYGRINARKAVEETPPDHELIIVGWATPPYIEPYGHAIINTTILNFGAYDESGVTVQLLINGSVVDSVTIDSLARYNFTTVSCSWTPTVEGFYNVTSYVIPVPNEIVIANNVVWTYIYVGSPLKVVVLHSAGNIIPDVINTWQTLNTEWYRFGDTMVHIDYTTLDKDDITYEDIAASDADVLIISCAYDPWMGWEFTNSEIDAITQYVREGHGLIATAGTLYYYVPNNNKLAPLFGLDETVTWDATGTDLLHLLNTTHPLFMNVPNPCVFPEVVTAIPSDWAWDSNELVGGEYLALGHYQESAIVTYRGLVYISPWLEIIPAYYHHHLQLLYNAITWSRYQKPEHELVVSLQSPIHLEPGETTVLNATVFNIGLNNETNVELSLLIDGVTVNSTIIPKLINGTSYSINYLWTPTVEAAYNVTAYAPPVPGENVTANNVHSRYVIVSYAPKILAYVQHTDYDQEYANALRAIDSTFGPNYLLTELWDYTQLDSMLPGNDILFVPEQEHTSLPTMEMIGASWSTTLSNFMAEGGIIIVCDFSGGSCGILTGAGLMAISGVNYITGSTVHLVDPSDPLAEGVSNTFIAPNGALSFMTDEVNVVFNDGTYPVVIHKTTGPGQIALIGFDYYASNPDADRILGNAVGLWIRYEHDIAVSLEAPTFLEPAGSTLLNATVHNCGLSNETDVELFLMIDGSVVNSTTVPELLAANSHTITYLWTPTLEGAYNVTAYALPVPDEQVIANNQATKFVTVAYPLIRPIEGQYASYTIFQIDISTGTITATGIWNFTYFRYISPYQINITMLMIDPSGYIQSGWMIVNIMNRMVERDSGIYWVGMWYPGWIETNVTIGSTINLLDSAVTIVDSEIILVGNRPIDCWKIQLEQYEYVYAFWYDKASGLWIGMEVTGPYTMRMVLAETNIPIGFMYEHDLAVMLDPPSYLEPSETTIVNATVYNIGLSNETGVELRILVNDTTIDTYVIPLLEAGFSYTHSYLWTPMVEGVYNVTAYAPPVPGENFTLNNAKSAIIHVQILPDIIIVNDNNGDFWINGTSLSEFEMALTTAGYDCFVWNESSMGNPPIDFLTKFKLVIWTCGDYWDWAVDPVDAVTLESYLVQGGNILLEGEDIGYDHGADSFMINVAHAIMQEDNTEALGLTVTDPFHPVTQGLPTNFTWLTIPPYDDGVSPTNGGAEVIRYTGTTWTAVTVFEGASIGSVVYYAFPIYCLAQLERETLIINSVSWLLPQEHDLAVTLEAPTLLQPGDSSLLNVTVHNRGLHMETVELQLLINRTVVNLWAIPDLPSGEFTPPSSFLWTPTQEGVYNVTAYVRPVPGEEYLDNNVASKYVGVGVVPLGVTAVYVAPYNTTVMLGQNFTITIMVANVENLYGWQAKLHYNASIIQCTQAFYPSDHVFAGQPNVPVTPIIDNTEGYVLYCCTLMGDVPSFNGTGKLCQIEFRGIAVSSCVLHFDMEETRLLDFYVQDIPHILIDGRVKIRIVGDLNGDGKVRVDDVYLAAEAFGSEPGHPRWNPDADVNGDGKVRVDDIYMIARNFGWTA